MNSRWAVCRGLMVERTTSQPLWLEGSRRIQKVDIQWQSDEVKEHGVHSDNSNKSDLLWPHTVSWSFGSSHPNPSHTPLKTRNLSWQLHLLTFVTCLPLPLVVGHHWKEEVTRPLRGKVDSDDSFQMRRNKMDGGGSSGSSMFLLVKESQIALFNMYNKFVLLLWFSHSLRLGLIPKIGATIVLYLSWCFESSDLDFFLALATGLTFCSLNWDNFIFFF